jgi:hypothetical protein
LRSAWTCSVPKHRIGPRGRSRDACTLRRLSPRRQPDRVTTISLPSCRLLRSLPEGRLGFRLREALGLHRALAFTSTAAWVISLHSAMSAIPLPPSWVAPLWRSWMVPVACPGPQQAADSGSAPCIAAGSGPDRLLHRGGVRHLRVRASVRDSPHPSVLPHHIVPPATVNGRLQGLALPTNPMGCSPLPARDTHRSFLGLCSPPRLVHTFR